MEAIDSEGPNPLQKHPAMRLHTADLVDSYLGPRDSQPVTLQPPKIPVTNSDPNSQSQHPAYVGEVREASPDRSHTSVLEVRRREPRATGENLFKSHLGRSVSSAYSDSQGRGGKPEPRDNENHTTRLSNEGPVVERFNRLKCV